MIDDIAIGTVTAEVSNAIAQRLKAESPYAKTVMATLTNGMARSGYIPDDASYPRHLSTYQSCLRVDHQPQEPSERRRDRRTRMATIGPTYKMCL